MRIKKVVTSVLCFCFTSKKGFENYGSYPGLLLSALHSFITEKKQTVPYM